MYTYKQLLLLQTLSSKKVVLSLFESLFIRSIGSIMEHSI